MTQVSAFIAQDILENPDNWSTDGDSINNGYYSVKLNCDSYGMGVSRYTCDAAEIDILKKVVSKWVADTVYTIPEHKEELRAKSARIYDENSYQKFESLVRIAHQAYLIHAKPDVLEIGISKALSSLEMDLSSIKNNQK